MLTGGGCAGHGAVAGDPSRPGERQLTYVGARRLTRTDDVSGANPPQR